MSAADFSRDNLKRYPFAGNAPVSAPEAGVRRVLYGAWDSAKKIAESQSPEAWKNRIVNVIDTRIVPRLSPEGQIRYLEIRPFVEQAAEIAGVGITTAEIVGAVALGKKAIDIARRQLELSSAKRAVQWVTVGEERLTHPVAGMPFVEEKVPALVMPVTKATGETYRLSGETLGKAEELYFREPRETQELHRQLVRHWSDLEPPPRSRSRVRVRVRQNAAKGLRMELNSVRDIRKRTPLMEDVKHKGWMRRRLNGTLLTLADMLEDGQYRMLADYALHHTENGVRSAEFRQLFEHAHRVASERFGWDRQPADGRRIWDFWNIMFDRHGLELLEQRSRRPGTRWKLPDVQIREMLKNIEYVPTVYVGFIPDQWTAWKGAALSGKVLPPERSVLQELDTKRYITTGSFLDRVRADRVLERYVELNRPPPPHTREEIETMVARGMSRGLRDRQAERARRKRILKAAARFMPERTWNSAEMAAKFSRMADLHRVPDEQLELIARIADRAWERRGEPDMLRLIEGLEQARQEGGGIGEQVTLISQLLERVITGDRDLQREVRLPREYYGRRERLRELARTWADDLLGMGISNLSEPVVTVSKGRKLAAKIAYKMAVFPKVWNSR